LLPETLGRNRIRARHRQYLADGWRVTAEASIISDRNFLEQYYEKEWDTDKDFTTGIEVKRLVDNMSYSIVADPRTNQFLTQTEHYPRGEHFMFGTPLLGDRLTWHEHTSLGYEQLRVEAMPALNQVDEIKLQPLPWEVNSQGARLISRHEIDAPFELGPVKFVPYALGEGAYWGQDLQGNSIGRAYGQGGVRASVPFWRVDPTVESNLFNVHGIAHKIVLDADVYAAGANQSLTDLPLYDPVDDDSGEAFRRRMRFNTYGLPAIMYPFNPPAPPKYDERLYALRSGLGSMVASPSMEIAGDLTAARLNARQRWQTKRGPPDRRRVIDWMIFDAGATIFPNANRDDFGQLIGLVNYDYRWHVGDRFAILSNGMFDFFSGGQKIVTVACTITRPPRGQIYLGMYSLNGPMTSNVISAFYNYRMSPKWISSLGISYDVSGNGLIGNQLALTRIGESFLSSFNFVADPYKNNVGFNFMLEPRIMPRSRLGMVGGSPIGLSGLSGLE
ncbi:MAG TPA: organic solvent tolerance protein OstA, partial [Pirellulales bacterium]|nr:organic solvent tolerance protein OstA [Pirellulales bacterium]